MNHLSPQPDNVPFYNIFILSLFAVVVFSFCFFPAKVSAKQLYTTDGVNIRSKPDSSSKVCAAVEAGTPVTKTGKNGNWVAVNVNGVNGYIYKDYLSAKQQTESENSVSSDVSHSDSDTTYVNSTGVNLRKKANSHCKVKAVLSEGEQVNILSADGNWVKVCTADGTKGYVYASYLGKKSSSQRKSSKNTKPSKSNVLSGYRSSALSYAKGRLGDLYSQELRDQEGYSDCSSLVRDAFLYASGKSIGDTTVTQTEAMEQYLYPISSITDVTPGDLVYHLSDDNHAGIYLGDGKVLHASQTAGKVKISTYDSESVYWEYGCNAASYCYENE